MSDKGVLEEYKRAKKLKNTNSNTSADIASSHETHSRRATKALATTQGVNQAVVKILSYAEGATQVNDTLWYILEHEPKNKDGIRTPRCDRLIDEDGNRYERGTKDYQSIVEEWSVDFDPPSSKESKTKVTVESEKDDMDIVYRKVSQFTKTNYKDIEYRIDKDRSRDKKNKVTITFDSASIDISALDSELSEYSISKKVSKPNKNRDSVHMMFSSPKGTKLETVESAVKNYLERHFKEEQYRYLHGSHYDTDNHHVHVVIKTKSETGKRLRLGVSKMMEVRKDYAKVMREKGVEVEASYRSERGVWQKSESRVVREIRARGEVPYIDKIIKEKARNRADEGLYKNMEIWERKQLERYHTEKDNYEESAKYFKELSFKTDDKREKAKYIAKYKACDRMAKQLKIPLTKVQEKAKELVIEKSNEIEK